MFALVAYPSFWKSIYDKAHHSRCSFISSFQKRKRYKKQSVSHNLKLNIIILTLGLSFQEGLYIFIKIFHKKSADEADYFLSGIVRKNFSNRSRIFNPPSRDS